MEKLYLYIIGLCRKVERWANDIGVSIIRYRLLKNKILFLILTLKKIFEMAFLKMINYLQWKKILKVQKLKF